MTPATLAALMRAFVEARVKPYYLHHPDLAPGTGHFRLSIAEGQALDARSCAAASPAWRSPPTCSTSPAATARCRWAPATSTRTAACVTDPSGKLHDYPERG